MGSADLIGSAIAGFDLGRTVANIADWVTLVAFAITLIGLLSAFLSRGRLSSRVFAGGSSSRSFTWVLSNGGASPVQQIAYHRAWITRTGRPVAGDGTMPLVQSLYPGEIFHIEVFDPEDVTWSGDARADQLRMPSPPDADGAVVVLTWRSALIPWRRRLRVFMLMFGQPEIELRGVRARKVTRDMATIGPDSRPAAIQRELTRANGGVAPVEESVQERYPREIADIRPDQLSQRDTHPQRIQLYLGEELLADGRLEGYEIHGPSDAAEPADRSAAPIDGTQGFIMINNQRFELNRSHRVRIFAR